MSATQGLWIHSWWQSFGIWGDAPEWVIFLAALFCTYLFVILPSGVFMAYLERKIAADLQARIGPNRTGPIGILQPLADLLKLLQKSGQRGMSWREATWFAVLTMALYSTVAVLPLGSLSLMVDTDMSAFLPFWAALVLGFGTMLLGLSQGSVVGWFGGVRVASQTLAGVFPALVSMMCAGVRAGGFKWSTLAAIQNSSVLSWTVISNPFEAIAFVVFLVSGMVLLAIPPLDAGLSQPDIHGGVAAHLYGRRLSMFRFGRFYGFFLWSVIAVVLFLGAWSLPLGLRSSLQEAGRMDLVGLLELLMVLAKTFILMLIMIWIARVTPRSRVDQITDFSWKVLSPFALFSLVGASLWAGWGAL